ncbi:MAG: hypothetical protein HON53_13000 [Planctomycetaceae bacterium]|jgi:hypothetical protein|nr:hypothetical protein [Planctomycetaceae bacterium]MBT6157947.1 hypothetical protein [Planctomycetaceae bacterium]MBT6487473.1 hypothetical protein [Planctomycetaceae bacterium]MBT6495068.1 hypothetical protein [Planctomycetaceae bacterium]
MPIEFNCHVCGKLLRTADEKAGKTAKCPGCGEKLTVPGTATETDDEFGTDEYGDGDSDADDYGDEDEFAPASSGGAKRQCPMCGESISRQSTRCEYCGEKVGGGGGSRRGKVRPTQIEVGEVISTAWEIYKSEMGVCVGGYVIMIVIVMVVAFGRGMCTGLINAGAAGMGNQQPNPGVLVLIVGVGLVAGFIELAIRLYVEAGFKRLLLNVARGKNAEIGDLFGAGRFYLRYLGNSILFLLMVTFGTAACIVPGIILALMFWPFAYLILDRDLPGIECLSRAKEITEGNWGAIFVLALAAFGINLLGICALCIGVLFTAPLTMLMFAVAYCRMSGRATARV